MNIKTPLNNYLKSAVIIAAAFFVAGVIMVEASSPFDIEFPIPELGGCAGKTECKAYCDNPENEEACHAFAAKHGLGATREEVDNKFKVIEEDGGPGGCAKDSEDPRKSCEAFCGKRDNMRQCVAYAKEHGLMDERELEEAEKVIKALDSGIKLPAACTDERSCKATCEEPKDMATARQCFAFAEAAGLLPPGVDRDKAEKMFKAIEEGRAPFKSPRDFEQCENPPSDEIFEKCINFAIENDLIPPEEAEIVKKTGGKGPGGCRGKEQCESYCEGHQDECFQFAEEHNLISEEDRARMREGMGKFKEALDNAPPEVTECLKNTLGEEVFQKLLAGGRPGGRDIGEKMQSCFEEFFKGQGGQHGDGHEGEAGDFRPPEGEDHGRPFGQPSDSFGSGGGPGHGSGSLDNMPPEVKACLENALGVDVFLKMKERQSMPPANFGEVLEGCVKAQVEARQQSPDGEMRSSYPPSGQDGTYKGEGGEYRPPSDGSGYPPQGSFEHPQEPTGYPSQSSEYPSHNIDQYNTPQPSSEATYPSPSGGSYEHPPESTNYPTDYPLSPTNTYSEPQTTSETPTDSSPPPAESHDAAPAPSGSIPSSVFLANVLTALRALFGMVVSR